MKSQKELIHQLINKDEFLLIILDACRYDMFKDECKYDGELEPVMSEGGSTWMWLCNTFDKIYSDVTYIAGNPHVGSLTFDEKKWKGTDKFGKVVPVWDFGWESINNLETVPPWNMTESTMQRKGKIIAHFMQPHWPYIGEYRLDVITEEFVKFRNKVLNLGGKLTKNDMNEMAPNVKILYPAGQNLIKAYRSNLRLVLKEIKPMLNRKNVVISADHGELFGENNICAHPSFQHPLLRIVPWFKPKESTYA